MKNIDARLQSEKREEKCAAVKSVLGEEEREQGIIRELEQKVATVP